MLTTAVVVASLCMSCTTSVPPRDAATSPADPVSTTAAPPTSSGAATPIDWHACDRAPAPFRCATIPVPIDHADPGGATLDLAIVKLPATDPSKSLGPLLVDPGGPGGSGIEFVEGNLWPREITDNFDLIGFDPRGVGASSPVDCGFDIEKLYSPDPAPPTPEAVTALESVSKAYVAACAAANAELLPHMSTRDVAADLDDLRRALGVAKINYLGYSYGTSIGQVYADTFPTHIRAMVLDGVVRLGQPGIEAARDQGLAFDKVFGEFIAKCPSLANCPADPAAAFRQVRTQLRKAPIPTDDPSRELTSGAFQLGVGQALYVTSFWPMLAKGLRDAVRGDGTTMQALADQYLGREPDGSYGNQTDAYFAVSCLDWDWPARPQAFIEAGREVAKTSPYLAEGIITDYIRCAYWPTPPRPLTPPDAKGSPLIVVVSTTGDPATPYANGVDLAARLPRGALITKVGDEHTAYGRGDACVDDAVSAYLISLRPPKNGLRCN
jgi:pimeloyl-ACP methyl ester carboxylesterase